MKKEFTFIWKDRWQSGSHWFCLAKKTWVRSTDIHSAMLSEYGERAIFVFEGFQCSIGETFKEEDVVELP